MSLDRKTVMQRADQLVAQGKLDPAILEYQRLLRVFPGDLALLNRLGDLCVQAGRHADAAATFKLLALQLQQDHQEKKAIALLRKLLRFAPEDLEAAHQLVELLHAIGASKEAAAVHFDLAQRLDAKGGRDQALEEFRLGVAADPSNLAHREALARRYQAAGQKEKASVHFLETAEAMALAGHLDDARRVADLADIAIAGPRLLMTQARIAVLACEADRAIALLREALTAYPGNPSILESLADIEVQAGRPAEGLAHLRDVRQPTPRILPSCEAALRDLAESRRLRLGLRLFRPLARTLASKGNGAAVATSLKAACKGHQHPVLWVVLAEIYMEGDQNEEALNALRQAYVMSSDRPSKVLNRAIHRKIEEIEGRQRTSGQIVREQAQMATMGIPLVSLKKLNPQAKLQVDQMEKDALGHAKLGNVQGAMSLFQEVIKLDPTRFSAVQSLIDLFVGSGQLPKAQKQCIDSAQVFNLFGRKQEARLLLDMAEKHFPGSSHAPRRMMGL